MLKVICDGGELMGGHKLQEVFAANEKISACYLKGKDSSCLIQCQNNLWF